MNQEAPQNQPTPLPVSDRPRPAFDPAKHLTRVSGNDYLEVKFRLVWLRDRDPDAELETMLIEHREGWALFKAVVRLSTGGMATGYAHGKESDFKDYLERAETRAIGRALAACGFGTQFCADHDEGGHVADAPVPPGRGQGYEPRRGGGGHAPDEAATQRQLRYLQSVAREAGIDAAMLDEMCMAEFGVAAGGLSRRDASTLIDNIQTRRQDVPR